MENLIKSLKGSTLKLAFLREGNSQIFTEKPAKCVGASTQSLGRNLEFKLTTEKCFVILPIVRGLFEAVIITRPTVPAKEIPLVKRLKVSAARLKLIKEGEHQIFIEKECKSAGTDAQRYASRCDFKIKTERCFVLIPKTTETLKAIIVTRLT